MKSLDSLMESSMALLAADCMASVITMANTDSTAATMDSTLPRFLPRKVPASGDNRQYDADEAKDCGDIVDGGNKLQHQTQRANTTAAMPQMVVCRCCSCGG